MVKPPKYLYIDDLLDPQKPRIFQLHKDKDISVSIPISLVKCFETYGDLKAHLQEIKYKVLTLEEIEEEIDQAVQKRSDEVYIDIPPM